MPMCLAPGACRLTVTVGFQSPVVQARLLALRLSMPCAGQKTVMASIKVCPLCTTCLACSCPCLVQGQVVIMAPYRVRFGRSELVCQSALHSADRCRCMAVLQTGWFRACCRRWCW